MGWKTHRDVVFEVSCGEARTRVISLLDHIVLSDDPAKFFSFLDNGIMPS